MGFCAFTRLNCEALTLDLLSRLRAPIPRFARQDE
jgi:hypothetical protein